MKVEEIAEQLWDKYSEHIDDNLFSLDSVAGTSVITSRRLFLKAVNEAVQISNESQWIDVKQLLPEENVVVLVLTLGCIETASFYHTSFYSTVEGTFSFVTHWMPLPDKPTNNQSPE